MIDLIAYNPYPEFTWLFRYTVPDAPTAVVRHVEFGTIDDPNIVMTARHRGENVTKILAKAWITEHMEELKYE